MSNEQVNAPPAGMSPDGAGWNPNRNAQNPRRAGRNNNSQQTRGARAANPDPDMRGHVFDVIGSNYGKVDFRKTMEQLVGRMGRTVTAYTTELTQALRDLTLTMPTTPANPPDGNAVAFEVWKEERKTFKRKEEAYQDFKATTYTVVLNSCMVAMQTKLEEELDFAAALGDGIALLGIIRRLTYSFDQGKKKEESFIELLEELVTLKRGASMLADYNDQFNLITKVLEEEGWSIVPTSLLTEVAASHGRADPNNDDIKEARECTMSVLFMKNAKTSQPGGAAESYHQHLRTNFIDGNDVYPTTVAQAFNNVNSHENNAVESGRRARTRRDRRTGRREEGVAFAGAAVVP